jgi:hypothetical protein
MLSSPMGTIPPKDVEDFWSARWSQNPDLNEEQIDL